MSKEWKPSGRLSGFKEALIRDHYGGYLPERLPVRPPDPAGSLLSHGVASTARLEVTREHGVRQDRFRKYQVFIDGWEVGAIAPGETHSFPLAEGHHELQLVVDWCGSPPVTLDLRPNQTVKIRCWRNAGILRVGVEEGLRAAFGKRPRRDSNPTDWIGVEIVDGDPSLNEIP